jgi:hypothetical protein
MVRFVCEFTYKPHHPFVYALYIYILFANGSTAPSGPGPPHYRGFTITLRHTTLGSTPLDEWSARRRDLYMTTHNTHNRHTSMPPAGFEPTIPSSERPQTHVLDCAATGIDSRNPVSAVSVIRGLPRPEYINTFTAKVDHGRFQYLRFNLPASTLVDLKFTLRFYI